MNTSLTKLFVSGFLTVVLLSGTAIAADSLSAQINEALAKKNIAEVQSLLTKGPGNVDEVLKALLKKTQGTMATDADFSNKMMAIATQHASQITPPSVPVICADLRRIVEKLGPDQAETEFFKTVMKATETFSKAPVVVAAGRPNECEQAWLRMGNIGEEALLAQTPGMRGPGLPPTTIRPGVPPTTPPPIEKPSAD